MTESLWIMFSGAFLAATLLPGGSEVLLAGLLAAEPQAWLTLWLAASVGNTLGSLTSFWLGRLGRVAKSPEELASGGYRRALALVQKYGVWSLLLAWTPVIGDLLCVLAGWLRLPVLTSTLLILIGKTVRYLLIVAAVLHWAI
ncbi:DedA family protein [Shewanella corallii]|uniref:DedA family protein n=1 Tax=Shewanella corallii TaxID=560080 RepID=A0ABT0N375_9GAMM|nr:YqaA family protein [Shewanella corallii]MCL2912872.1 DedA family protein [Shewanella corallii]